MHHLGISVQGALPIPIFATARQGIDDDALHVCMGKQCLLSSLHASCVAVERQSSVL